MFQQRGFDSAGALQQSYGHLYGLVQMQAAALAYIDAIWVMGSAALFMIPMVLLLKKNDPRTASAMTH